MSARTFRTVLVTAAILVIVGVGLPERSQTVQPLASLPTRPLAAEAAQDFPRLSRVAVMVLENRSYREVIGSPKAPFLNRLAAGHALATNYYAIGHPSLPNYLALTGGGTFGIRRDCNRCDTEAPLLVDQLNSAHISWKAYFQGLPFPGFLGARAGDYSKHYNPFAYSDRLGDSPAVRSRIVPLTEFDHDLSGGNLPRFTWFAPDLRHDGHNGSVAASDRFAARLVPRILHALGPRGALFLTWDEGKGRTGPAGGHVALISAGAAAARHRRVAVHADHYSLLRTIEAGLGLPALKRAGAPSTPLLERLLRPA